MRVLITGATGFAGSHLAAACAGAGDEVFGIAREAEDELGPAADGASGVQWLHADLRDGPAVVEAVRSAAPDVVFHLAALSSVGRSWTEPSETVIQNAATAVHTLEGVRHGAPGARVVWVSSCEVYGPAPELPTTEEAPLVPANPYAVTKVASEQLARVYAEAYGFELVVARPFNHAGPGQRDIFLLSSLARQAAAARRAGVTHVRIATGNPDTRRDFTDVRDVARAYRLLASSAPPGTYNVASGHSVSAGDQVRLLAELLAPIDVEHVVDPARVRAVEVMDLRGSHNRLTAATGWEPSIPLRQTMAEAIAWWEAVDAEPARR